MTQLRKGMQFTCPHCDQDSVVKQITEMDGWTKLGESLVCALCGEKVQDSAGEAPVKRPHPKNDSGKKSLLDFLGTDEAGRDEIIADDGNRQFCRDCSHLLEHPFKVYCLRHKKDVNPMDDCPDFDRKES